MKGVSLSWENVESLIGILKTLVECHLSLEYLLRKTLCTARRKGVIEGGGTSWKIDRKVPLERMGRCSRFRKYLFDADNMNRLNLKENFSSR